MATKRKKQKSESKLTFPWIILSILGCLLVFVGVAYAVQLVNQHKLENRFSILEKDLDRLKSNIEKNNTTVKIKKDKYCDKYAQVFSDGPLHCDIELSSEDPFTKEQALSIISDLESSPDWSTLSKPSLSDFPYKIGKYIHKDSNIDCNLTFSEHASAQTNGESFSFRLQCFELSKKSFYPYRN